MADLQQRPEAGRARPVPSGPAFPIVGIGASAHGGEGVRRLLEKLPEDTGAAFVVVVQPGFGRSAPILPADFAASCPLPVVPVSDGAPLVPDRVYMTSAGALVTLEGASLRVSPAGADSYGHRTPLDAFFRSLAEECGAACAGVLLSTGSHDGALGLEALREVGGLTLASGPAPGSLPPEILAAGAVDHVLALEEVPPRLIEHLSRWSPGCPVPAAGLRAEIEGRLDEICGALDERTGHDFRRYKRGTLARRVERRIQLLQDSSPERYLDRLRREPAEAERLFRDLLIGVTHFFRDPAAFEALEEKVVPELFAGKGPHDTVRVWVPGCSTGEEAYSIAILLRERVDHLERPPRVQIFATDLDPVALEAARQALYTAANLESTVSAARLERFFERRGNMAQVAKEIRETCLFSEHDLAADPPFSRLDLISCRNVLIYLQPELQRRLLPLTHFALRLGGFLFLGPAEGLGGGTELFRAVDPKHRIFRKEGENPLGRTALGGWRPPERRPARSWAPDRPAVADPSRVFERLLLETFGPAGVVVDARGEIVYFSPRTGRYLEPASGSPRANLFEMAREGLRVEVRTALHRAVTSGQTVVQRNVTLPSDPAGKDAAAGRPEPGITLVVRPLADLVDGSDLFLVLFQDSPLEEAAEAADTSREARAPERAGGGDLEVRRLEEELRSAKDHLRITVELLESSNEELIASNEELISMNEELQSANEEMQTSGEELQAVNQELERVNAELRQKVGELDRAHGDLRNLVRSTGIATVFVGRELRVQRFTPPARELFPLIDADVGRDLTDIAPRFSGVDLAEEVRAVLRTHSPREREVRSLETDAWYLLRILPYQTKEETIDGVVLTFVEVTELKRAEQEKARLAAIVESSQDAILGKSLDGTIQSWNRGAERLYGYTAEEVLGRPMTLLVPQERLAELAGIYDRIRRGERVAPFETERLRKDGSRVHVLLTISPIRNAAGEIAGASAIARDVTERVRVQQALAEEARRKDDFLAMLGHELRNPLSPIRNCLYLLNRDEITPEQSLRARRTMERQVSHLTRLVDDLLDISRISRGKVLLQTRLLDLVEVVRATAEDLRGMLEDRGLHLEVRLPDRPLLVTGDPTRLSQIVGNVLQNAGKFTERGGRVEVSAEAEPGGDTVRVDVRDTGIGMAPELLERIFDPFSQASLAGVRGQGGLGLGLALVKALVELHGGSVEASSAGLGQGSRITLRLALAEQPEAEPEAGERRAAGTAARPLRCLLVEDNQDAAESLALLLELSGHEVTLARDGAEGLAKAPAVHPEVVLCDIGLPGGLDGYGVARALRADPELAGAFLIALTGYGQEDDRRRAREAGFDAHLTKPADLEKLERLLAGVAERG